MLAVVNFANFYTSECFLSCRILYSHGHLSLFDWLDFRELSDWFCFDVPHSWAATFSLELKFSTKNYANGRRLAKRCYHRYWNPNVYGCYPMLCICLWPICPQQFLSNYGYGVSIWSWFCFMMYKDLFEKSKQRIWLHCNLCLAHTCLRALSLTDEKLSALFKSISRQWFVSPLLQGVLVYF